MNWWDGFWNALLIFDIAFILLLGMLCADAYIYERFFSTHYSLDQFSDITIKCWSKNQMKNKEKK